MPTVDYPVRILEDDLSRTVSEKKKPVDKEDKPKTPKKSELVFGYRNPVRSKEEK